jgi:hypothetical protein
VWDPLRVSLGPNFSLDDRVGRLLRDSALVLASDQSDVSRLAPRGAPAGERKKEKRKEKIKSKGEREREKERENK